MNLKHVHPTPKASDRFKATLGLIYSTYSFVWQSSKLTIILGWEDTEEFLLPPLAICFPPWEQAIVCWATLMSSFVRLRRWQCRERENETYVLNW